MTDTTSIKHPTELTSGDFTAAENPFLLFAEWFAEAQANEPSDPNAMALATVAGVIAAAVPASRASRLSPVEAIRHA